MYTIIIKTAVITIFIMCGIFFLWQHKNKFTQEYKIEISIRPYEFNEGLGSKYYVEVVKGWTVLLSLSEGINYLTEEIKIEMYNKAVTYIQKCKEAEKKINQINNQ